MEIEMLDAPEVREEPTTALAVQDRAALALGSTKTRADLVLLAVKFGNIIEIKNKAGRDECHAALMVLQDARIAVQKASKAAREDATRFSKAVIAEENSLVEITAKEELRLFNLRKVWDDAVAAETAKAIADAHQARLDEQRRAFMQEQADARARQSALMEQEEAQRKALADERAAFEAEKAAKAAADQKAIDDAALAAAPVILEPAAGAAEIIAQAEAGDVEYITAAAIDPSDADIIFCAARAVSLEYGLTFGEAIHRLAAVESWTQTEGATA